MKTSASRSGSFTPRVLVAFAFCSFGVFLGMFSLAATPLAELAPVAEPTVRSESSPGRKPAETSLPPDPAKFPSTFAGNANRLPPGVPLPLGAEFSPVGQEDPSRSSPTPGFQEFAGMPLRAGMASPDFSEQQPTPPSVPQLAGSESMPLASVAQSDWSIVTSPNSPPNTPTHNYLEAVTCLSASDCWAVGYNISGSAYRTLIERWNGTSWGIVSSPNISAQNNQLHGLTCLSASDCWAVGYYYTGSAWQTLIEHWDGISWTLVTSPNTSTTQSNFLFGVTCVSASDCWAVGLHEDEAGSLTYQTLIERWNGTSWAIVASPNPTSAQTNYLEAVTCLSASDCWTVGYYYSGSAWQTLIEHWDGTSWEVVSSPNSSATQLNILQGVTCVSASDCWAVGTYAPETGGRQALIERWNGTSWAIVTSPSTSATPYDFLFGVACASASECSAVGWYYNGTAYQTVIERWDGTSWAIVSSPNGSSGTAHHNILSGVTCVSASDCWAAGDYWNGTIRQTSIDRWDGSSWAMVSSPNSTAPARNFLSGVTCVSASDCWAVGYYFPGTVVSQTLIEHWDGSAWTIVASPNTSANRFNYLQAVTCVSASDCWAVGYYDPGSGVYQTLIERWNGSTWTIVSSPNPPITQGTFLQGVACVSASDCWAVGYYNTGAAANPLYQTLIAHWDGSAWAIVTSPNTLIAQSNLLYGLTCLSPSQCWAVGYYNIGTTANPLYQTLIERWDGTAWAIVSSPNTSATQSNQLADMTCVSASECWAVGSYYNGTIQQTLIERWNGTSWAIVSSPNTSPTQSNQLAGVTCVSASECWAIGSYDNGTTQQTLIERWDGTSWTIVSSPNTNATQSNQLADVTCVSAAECWAVGQYFNGSVYQTLVERYTASLPLTPTRVVSRKTHGSAGTFEVDLPLTGTPGIECRSGGASGDYTLVLRFANPFGNVASANVTSGAGFVSSSAIDGTDSRNYVVNLTGVTNAQVITVSLTDVTDSDGNSSDTVSSSMAVLIGDTTASRSVNSSDISQTKSESGQLVTAANFRQDVTVSGSINSSDISLVKSKSGTALP